MDRGPYPSYRRSTSEAFRPPPSPPVKHFSEALGAAFDPFETGAGFEVGSLLVMAAWGVAGLLVAARYFSWEPRR